MRRLLTAHNAAVLLAFILSMAWAWLLGFYFHKGLTLHQTTPTVISSIDTRLPCPDKLVIYLASSATCTIEFVHGGSSGRLVMVVQDSNGAGSVIPLTVEIDMLKQNLAHNMEGSVIITQEKK